MLRHSKLLRETEGPERAAGLDRRARGAARPSPEDAPAGRPLRGRADGATMSDRWPEGNAIVYCEGAFGTTNGKTAHGLVRRSERYRVLSVIDSRHGGTGRRRGARRQAERDPRSRRTSTAALRAAAARRDAGNSLRHRPGARRRSPARRGPDGGRRGDPRRAARRLRAARLPLRGSRTSRRWPRSTA